MKAKWKGALIGGIIGFLMVFASQIDFLNKVFCGVTKSPQIIGHETLLVTNMCISKFLGTATGATELMFLPYIYLPLFGALIGYVLGLIIRRITSK